MNDLYQEILIKRQSGPADTVKKALLIALTVILAVGGIMLIPPLLFLAIGMGVLSKFLFTRMDKEYEYLYVNGDIDVDVIMGKQKRKKVGSYPLEALQLLAPSQSHDLDQYRNQKSVVEKDYTSLLPDVKSYSLVYSLDNRVEIVKLEIDDVIIKDIRRNAPRKISRDISLLN